MSELPSRLNEIADWFERDRREPDKTLCNVQSLRREAMRLGPIIEAASALRDAHVLNVVASAQARALIDALDEAGL